MSHMLQDKDLNFYYSYRYIIDIIAFRNSRVKALADIDDTTCTYSAWQKDRNSYSTVSEAFFKLLKNKHKKITLFDCDHWFYDALSYNYFQSKYSEESRKQIIVTIKKWIDTMKP